MGAQRVGLSELFCESDFISINVVLTDQTRGMIQADLLKLMKPTAYIINMARGPVWNEGDIFQALQAGRIAGAGADVFESEPPARDHPLFGLDNFVGTPHMAAHTEESLMRMSMVAQDIVRVLAGEEPEFEDKDKIKAGEYEMAGMKIKIEDMPESLAKKIAHPSRREGVQIPTGFDQEPQFK
ncbi:MAG: hypothetical protein IH898_08615 [Planctomycetes bacterium]|nr:hypothetical protein [Planctomycetota bacterium]